MSNINDSDNYFARLNAINVNEHVEKKGGFSYLSWPYAVAQLRLADPTATWEVRRFEGLPYLDTEAGVFVEVAATVHGVTLSQIHPVLDGRNRPLMAPSAFDINTSLQRCLVKAIALHGLGLYIYAGEDLPQPVGAEAANDPIQPPPQMERPNLTSDRPPVRRDDRRERITKSQQAQIHRLAIEVGVSLDRVLTYFGAAELGDIAANDFLRVIRSLEKRRQAA
ncbi:DUF1071 domain-containing protein [Acidovorax sp. LjRoot38]|uniref:Sak single strand annealing protein n=1 Tax=Acidovorax sp. LjRoot38 TaxID=3342327 RepID=UPI003ECF8266